MLIGDDERSVRESLRRWFLPEGYRVETAAEAVEELDKLRDSSFDIVLLDIKMPLETPPFVAFHSEFTFARAIKAPMDPTSSTSLTNNQVDQHKILPRCIRPV